jgi:hypothetical protein
VRKRPTEQSSRYQYVHTKAWVFDDEFATLGSMNINWRGYTHDSELVAGFYQPPGNGRSPAQALRMSLWARHLGLRPHSDGSLDSRAEKALSDPIAALGYWTSMLGPQMSRADSPRPSFHSNRIDGSDVEAQVEPYVWGNDDPFDPSFTWQDNTAALASAIFPPAAVYSLYHGGRKNYHQLVDKLAEPRVTGEDLGDKDEVSVPKNPKRR